MFRYVNTYPGYIKHYTIYEDLTFIEKKGKLAVIYELLELFAFQMKRILAISMPYVIRM